MTNRTVPTLRELRQLAAIQPAVQFCLEQYDRQELTFEQALMVAVAILSEQVESLQSTLQSCIDRAPLPSPLYLEMGRADSYRS